MLENYLKIAFRNLLKHKSYTFINIVGLALGITCCALILLYVHHELSYDRFHDKAEDIYRLTVTFDRDGQKNTESIMAAPIGPALKAEYAEILDAVRLRVLPGETLVKNEDRRFYEDNVYIADPNIFDLFDFTFLQGNPKTALQNPNSIVLSRDAAEKYFGGREPPLGKTLTMEMGATTFEVTGILDKIPEASHIRPDFIIPFINYGERRLKNWWGFSFQTYVLLQEQSSPQKLEKQFPNFVTKHYANAPNRFPKIALRLQPLVDVHLGSNFDDNPGTLSAMTYVTLFSILALFIIGIACINFMNLTTARSHHRAREVGVRKVVGAMRRQLIAQFLSEALLLSFAALVLAIVAIEFFLPSFNELTGKNLNISFSQNWIFVIGFLALAVLVGIAAGSYPAFFLSRFRPVDVLKGKFTVGTSGAKLRQILVITQFALSIILIVSTLVVRNQLEFIRNKRLGYDQEQVIVLSLNSEEAQSDWPVFKTELLQHPEFVSVTASSSVPSDKSWWVTGAAIEGSSKDYDVYTYQVDYDFLATFEMELAAGRNFSREFQTDSSSAFIVNEAAVKEFGWMGAQAALGKQLFWQGQGRDNPKIGQIVGVVKDFHFRPLYEEIAPAVFHLYPGGKNFLVARVRLNRVVEAMNILDKAWKSFDPNHPLVYAFLDEKVDAQYGAEVKLSRIFGIFSMLAIVIACLGLLGLASFTAERRTKEIGVRKVMGATASNVVVMLTGEFLGLVLIAIIVSIPLSWFAMTQWLQNFAYRAPISAAIFLLAGFAAIAVAAFTVSFQSLKAALTNPVKALRYE